MKAVLLMIALANAPAPAQRMPAVSASDLQKRVESIVTALDAVPSNATDARSAITRIYLDQYEVLEGVYGPGSGQPETLVERIREGEAEFHKVLQASPAALPAAVAGLRQAIAAIEPAAQHVKARGEDLGAMIQQDADGTARTSELQSVIARLDAARIAYAAGRSAEALQTVETMYLEGIEPLESRLPAKRVNRIERLIHMDLRPQIARGASLQQVDRNFAALRGELLGADSFLSAGSSFWFGAANAFAILVREGLEAVLLIAALLAYLTATGAEARHRRQIYWGVAAGCGATLATWLVARLVIPIGGGSRELVEGITGLVAVGVLLYVSNWLFQKTYIHDWKDYLRKQVGNALTTGSAFAMASLAFAAIYREGFETVLFYQALVFDTGAGAVLAGALPGLLVIVAIGIAIIRMGVKLPLKRMFAITNAVLLYLAFVLVGKGFYNLQEAGVFSPHPISWLPDMPPLRLLFGFYPMMETLFAQLLFASLIAATFIFYKRRLAATRRLQTA